MVGRKGPEEAAMAQILGSQAYFLYSAYSAMILPGTRYEVSRAGSQLEMTDFWKASMQPQRPTVNLTEQRAMTDRDG